MFRQTVELGLGTDGSLAMAVCQDSQIDGGRGTLCHQATGKWSTFWQAEGDVAVNAGATGTFRQAPFGLKPSIDEVPVIERGDKISIYLYDETRGGPADNHGRYELDDPQSARGSWMNNNRDLHGEPRKPD